MTTIPSSRSCMKITELPPQRLCLPRTTIRLSELLRQAGRDDAAILARPVKLLGNFKPAKMISDLQALAERCGGSACIVLIRKMDMLPEMIWSFDCGNGVNRLVNCRMNGGWIIGTLEFNTNDTVTWHAEDGDEKELYELLLSTFARGYMNNKRWEPAEALLALANKNFSDETVMNEFSLMVRRPSN